MQPFPGRFRGPSRREATAPVGRSLPRYRAPVARRAAALALLCVLAAGCGGGSDGHALLNRTLGSLGRIGSGNLNASLLLKPRGIGGENQGGGGPPPGRPAPAGGAPRAG